MFFQKKLARKELMLQHEKNTYKDVWYENDPRSKHFHNAGDL